MLNNLMSLFLKPEDDGADGSGREVRPPMPPHGSAQAPAAASAAPVEPPSQSPGDSETKFSGRLESALTEANLPNIDFYEFLKSLEAMAPLIPDEGTRYRAALGSLVASGASTEKILGTASHYLNVLDEKEKSFRSYIAEQVQERVDRALVEADRLKQEIRAKGEQITTLTQEIAALTRSEASTRTSAEIARAEIEAYSSTFERVKSRYTQLIQTTREKLATYAGLSKN